MIASSILSCFDRAPPFNFLEAALGFILDFGDMVTMHRSGIPKSLYMNFDEFVSWPNRASAGWMAACKRGVILAKAWACASATRSSVSFNFKILGSEGRSVAHLDTWCARSCSCPNTCHSRRKPPLTHRASQANPRRPRRRPKLPRELHDPILPLCRLPPHPQCAYALAMTSMNFVTFNQDHTQLGVG